VSCDEALGFSNQFFRVLFGFLTVLAEFARAPDVSLISSRQILFHSREKRYREVQRVFQRQEAPEELIWVWLKEPVPL
jgi:hypothetical protein